MSCSSRQPLPGRQKVSNPCGDLDEAQTDSIFSVGVAHPRYPPIRGEPMERCLETRLSAKGKTCSSIEGGPTLWGQPTRRAKSPLPLYRRGFSLTPGHLLLTRAPSRHPHRVSLLGRP
ncbi:hypothetical protein MRX96_033842 [Rhipicephalus microplus]